MFHFFIFVYIDWNVFVRRPNSGLTQFNVINWIKYTEQMTYAVETLKLKSIVVMLNKRSVLRRQC